MGIQCMTYLEPFVKFCTVPKPTLVKERNRIRGKKGIGRFFRQFE
jgi:hypothetical protein